MAAVVGVRFLIFAGERAAFAERAFDHLSKEEEVLLGLWHRLAAQDSLHPVKERLSDQGLMRAREGLAGRANPDHAHVEGVVEDGGEGVREERFAAAGAEAQFGKLVPQFLETDGVGGVSLEEKSHQRPFDRIDGLHFALASVEIADGCGKRVDALLEAAIDALLHLFTQIADVVGGDHGLDIGRETAAPRQKIEIVAHEPDIDAAVDEIAKVGPVPQVARAAIDLVDDETVGTAGAKLGHHLGEPAPSSFGSRLHLLEPTDNREVAARGIHFDGAFLFGEG